MSDEGYQSLGLNLGPFEMSDLTLSDQANEAFARIEPHLPDEDRQLFIERAERALRQASEDIASGGQVDVDDLTQRFSAILRDILG